MKAIETHYAGCRFRSRLEARWAFFMDLMDVRWEYEHEGWELPSGRYLPDFRLPHAKVHLEIKGETPTQREVNLALELASEACVDGWRYRMLAGGIPRSPSPVPGKPGIAAVPCFSAMTEYVPIQDMKPIGAAPKDQQGIQQTPEGFAVGPTSYRGIPLEHWRLRKSFWTAEGWTNTDLAAALTKARSARFEHGEAPQ
ncbi:hypothetical protein [Micromonospora sp. WMMD980]|uniref:hypothetical protein n=1 Tax=Micromonospora sp. WMMD980 TaxID=3016088 RepID=UPI002415EB44|nr:hypothetical protein [Micromonospora sp. WMMD980]MDG4803171.1 hypothetical protein [Micromonospora sp. WMMD980]